MRVQISLSFMQGTYGETEEFCRQVISKTDSVTRYVDLQAQVDIVKPSYLTFIDSVTAATHGGKLLTQAKLKAKNELLITMEDLAALAKVFAKGEESYATEAGFDLRKKAVRSNSPLERPELNYLKRGVLSGSIEGEIKNFPKGANEVGIKHSYDGWATVKNSIYTSGKKFNIENLEVKKDVEIKVCFIGTFQRKSDDSDPMSIFVL